MHPGKPYVDLIDNESSVIMLSAHEAKGSQLQSYSNTSKL